MITTQGILIYVCLGYDYYPGYPGLCLGYDYYPGYPDQSAVQSAQLDVLANDRYVVYGE